jgi:hypothetical protein
MALTKTDSSGNPLSSISFSQIQNEFKDTAGGSTSKKITGYYRDGTIIATDVEDPNSIPNTSERTIKFSDFLNAGDFQQVEIGGQESEVNLKSKATSAGWNGNNPVRVIMKSDAVYYGGSYGARTDEWPMIVKFTIKGKILGKGGDGGNGSTNGSAGGNGKQALRIDKSIHTLTIAEGGAIAGGGGGGGSGKSSGYDSTNENAAAGGGGGAGAGKGGSACNFDGSNNPSNVTSGGGGGGVNSAGTGGGDQGTKEGISDTGLGGAGGNAGGGGGGFDIAEDTVFSGKLFEIVTTIIVGGGAGSGGGGGRVHPGTEASGGKGGGGKGGKTSSGGNSGTANDGGRNRSVAGGGGGWGSSGGSGGSGKSGGNGGIGIKLNGNLIGTYNNNGTLNGGKS